MRASESASQGLLQASVRLDQKLEILRKRGSVGANRFANGRHVALHNRVSAHTSNLHMGKKLTWTRAYTHFAHMGNIWRK